MRSVVDAAGARRGARQVGEHLGDHDHRGDAGAFTLDRVVDTPRRARPSSAEADDGRVDGAHEAGDLAALLVGRADAHAGIEEHDVAHAPALRAPARRSLSAKCVNDCQTWSSTRMPSTLPASAASAGVGSAAPRGAGAVGSRISMVGRIAAWSRCAPCLALRAMRHFCIVHVARGMVPDSATVERDRRCPSYRRTRPCYRKRCHESHRLPRAARRARRVGSRSALRDARSAVVRVTRASICGSDLHLVHGTCRRSPARSIGHECVGVVEAVGARRPPLSQGRPRHRARRGRLRRLRALPPRLRGRVPELLQQGVRLLARVARRRRRRRSPCPTPTSTCAPRRPISATSRCCFSPTSCRPATSRPRTPRSSRGRRWW